MDEEASDLEGTVLFVLKAEGPVHAVETPSLPWSRRH